MAQTCATPVLPSGRRVAPRSRDGRERAREREREARAVGKGKEKAALDGCLQVMALMDSGSSV